ncbi:IS66 family insertion sequence element accessory protein TnpB [Paraburkholderia phenazinium]
MYRNRMRNSVKLPLYERSGLWLMLKRIEEHRLSRPRPGHW